MTLPSQIIHQLERNGITFCALYPGAKIQQLYDLMSKRLQSISVSKEEEGVGICAGASLAGANSCMLIQSTGFGNMINALCSLTLTYELPLLILASWRGIYKESIPAQVRLGKSLPNILKAIGCHLHIIKKPADLSKIENAAQQAYQNNSLQAVLISPQLWASTSSPKLVPKLPSRSTPIEISNELPPLKSAQHTREEIIRIVVPYLQNKLVISNIGMPSRELYHILPQPSNFYMLGSLGLASSIGLGVALNSKKSVIVIDGDGSLLSNLGSLSTIASKAPTNLTILAIDNGVHGSTGNQPTSTQTCVDLAKTAQSLGIREVYRGSTAKQLESILSNLQSGPHFIHIPARPGNAQVPTIPLSPQKIKQLFMQAVLA
ncbi:MAG: sulfopyruvate decarboxylase subunit beta [Candidatus Thorarchaeota archaeon]